MTELDERFICLVSLAARDLSGMIARLGHAAEKIKKEGQGGEKAMGKCDTCKEERIMTKEEFIERVNARIILGNCQISKVHDISDADFSVISTVYVFHPAIDDLHGKDQTADLYVSYGISVIRDMLLRAERMKELEKQYGNIRSSLASLQKEMDSVRKGNRIDLF
ncbi:hypothetical protein D7V90_10075 [bacterium 1xD42-87]|nr:hypothetical protein D7V90_10075 [bacterium 1xD42-87]